MPEGLENCETSWFGYNYRGPWRHTEITPIKGTLRLGTEGPEARNPGGGCLFDFLIMGVQPALPSPVGQGVWQDDLLRGVWTSCAPFREAFWRHRSASPCP
jgi:hypothetical protein